MKDDVEKIKVNEGSISFFFLNQTMYFQMHLN